MGQGGESLGCESGMSPPGRSTNRACGAVRVRRRAIANTAMTVAASKIQPG